MNKPETRRELFINREPTREELAQARQEYGMNNARLAALYGTTETSVQMALNNYDNERAKEAEGIRKRMVKLEAENRTLKEQFTRWASFDIIGKPTTAPCLQVKCSYCRTYFNRITGSELNYCPVCGARNEDVPVTNRAI